MSSEDGGACRPGAYRRARRLFAEGFEADVSADVRPQAAEVVAHESCSGARCARVNLLTDRDDPLLGVHGRNNATLEVEVAALRDPALQGVIVAHWLRVDDALWRGSSLDGSDPIRIQMKGGYYGLRAGATHWTQAAFFIGLDGGARGAIHLGDNGGATAPWRGWHDEPWSWGPSNLHLETGHPWGADGQWHLFELEIHYLEAGTHHLAQLRIDGRPATSERRAPDGWFALPAEYRLELYTTSYTSAHNIERSVDRSGTACGIQFDELEIWAIERCEG